MIGTVVPILEGRDVTIVPTSGFDSTPALFDSFNRMLEQYHEVGKNVHVLYYGDSDPSGEGMDEDLMNRFNRLKDKHQYSDIKIDFQRIAVTKAQIDQYNLPTDINAKTREKLERDPRAAKFLEKHGELRQVELDALPAIVPDQFRQLMLDSWINTLMKILTKECLQRLKSNIHRMKLRRLLKISFWIKQRSIQNRNFVYGSRTTILKSFNSISIDHCRTCYVIPLIVCQNIAVVCSLDRYELFQALALVGS